jgi:hypothetical protein
LTISQEDIQDELKGRIEDGKSMPTPFEFLLINCYHYPDFKKIAAAAFEFFLHQPINFFFEEKMLVVGDLGKVVQEIKSLDNLVLIKEDEYFDFQNKIREVIGDKPIKPPEPPNPNEDPRITAMKEKARKRDKLKAKQNAKDGISTQACLVAICCMGIGLTPLNIGEMSYAAIGPIMKMS